MHGEAKEALTNTIPAAGTNTSKSDRLQCAHDSRMVVCDGLQCFAIGCNCASMGAIDGGCHVMCRRNPMHTQIDLSSTYSIVSFSAGSALPAVVAVTPYMKVRCAPVISNSATIASVVTHK